MPPLPGVPLSGGFNVPKPVGPRLHQQGFELSKSRDLIVRFNTPSSNQDAQRLSVAKREVQAKVALAQKIIQEKPTEAAQMKLAGYVSLAKALSDISRVGATLNRALGGLEAGQPESIDALLQDQQLHPIAAWVLGKFTRRVAPSGGTPKMVVEWARAFERNGKTKQQMPNGEELVLTTSGDIRLMANTETLINFGGSGSEDPRFLGMVTLPYYRLMLFQSDLVQDAVKAKISECWEKSSLIKGLAERLLGLAAGLDDTLKARFNEWIRTGFTLRETNGAPPAPNPMPQIA